MTGMIKLPWWCGFWRRLYRWFWYGLLRRPVKQRNWTARYTGVGDEEAKRMMRRALGNTKCKLVEEG